MAGLSIAPVLLSVTGVLLAEPNCQRFLLHAFAGQQASPALEARLRGLLRLMVGMQACDCIQSQMQGVVQVRHMSCILHALMAR